MPQITITEALAMLKVKHAKIEKKWAFIETHLMRQEKLKDPLANDGGSVVLIQRELQAIGDLETDIVSTQRAIREANLNTPITTTSVTRSLSDWLTWRKEVAEIRKQHLDALSTLITRTRQQAQNRGLQVIAANVNAESPDNFVVNINEKDLAKWREDLEAMLGTLDGLFSLKNATVLIDVP